MTTTAAAAVAAVVASGGGSGSIALLLPESKTARYESQDRPNFENKVKELCSDCDDPVLERGSGCGEAAAAGRGGDHTGREGARARPGGRRVGRRDRPDRAKQSQIPVISYDRLITDADIDYYISFDNEQVGKLQGESLVKKLDDDGAKGDIIMINGAPTDNNAKLFKEGAHSVIDGELDDKVANYLFCLRAPEQPRSTGIALLWMLRGIDFSRYENNAVIARLTTKGVCHGDADSQRS